MKRNLVIFLCSALAVTVLTVARNASATWTRVQQGAGCAIANPVNSGSLFGTSIECGFVSETAPSGQAQMMGNNATLVYAEVSYISGSFGGGGGTATVNLSACGEAFYESGGGCGSAPIPNATNGSITDVHLMWTGTGSGWDNFFITASVGQASTGNQAYIAIENWGVSGN